MNPLTPFYIYKLYQKAWNAHIVCVAGAKRGGGEKSREAKREEVPAVKNNVFA